MTQPADNLSFYTPCWIYLSLCAKPFLGIDLEHCTNYEDIIAEMRPSHAHNLIFVVMTNLGSWFVVTEAHAWFQSIVPLSKRIALRKKREYDPTS